MGMGKIPVGATIGHAYSYLFKNILTITGIIWLPFAIIAAGGVLLNLTAGESTKALIRSDATQILRVWYLFLPFYLAVFVLAVMQIEGITRHALGLRSGPVYFYFSLGKPIWRIIGAYLLFILLAIAVVAVFVIGGILIGMVVAAVTGVTPGTRPSGGAAAAIGFGVVAIGLVAYCAFIYWIVRQAFLLTPVVVAEERIGFRRAWQLGRGNFWRIFVIALAILVPIGVIEAFLMFNFLMPGLPPTAAQGATPAQIAAWNAAYFQRISSYWYLLVPAYFLLSAVIYGLLCSAQAFAYRSLVPAEKAEDVF
jgi:hypothetical protein